MSKAEDIKAARIKALMTGAGWDYIYFKGSNLMRGPGTRGFIRFDSRKFGSMVQERYSGTSENMIKDFAKTVQTMAPDWSELDNFIAFGEKVWDMKTLSFDPDQLDYVYSSPITPNDNTEPVMDFLKQLARGDEDLARDYLQAIAPLVMYRKPTGVIWFVGDGANGKSSLINALYRLMDGRYLASLTTAAIEDGKATPVLTGIIGNIVRESSEARVEDTERYKAIGTHEPFAVRQLYTQENITVDTNFHTIFNANNVPVFSDKTQGARRRTLIVPFKAHFQDDPTFEDRTFTPEFLGGLVTLLLEEAKVIRDNGYRYRWSEATVSAKEEYDSEVNSAEAFLNHLEKSGVVGFTNYNILKFNYDTWCYAEGLVPLSATSLKRVVKNTVGAERRSSRERGLIHHHYLFSIVGTDEELVWLDNGYGMPKVDVPKASQKTLSEDW